jgi:hypothetical protein
MAEGSDPKDSTPSEGADCPYPVWKDDCHLSLEWIRDKLEYSPCIPKGATVISCSVVVDKSNQTRKRDRVCEGATLALTVTLQTEGAKRQSLPLMIKQVSEEGLSTSQTLGLAREALCYQTISNSLDKEQQKDSRDKLRLNQFIPTVYYAHGDMSTGHKIIIMDDLSSQAVDSAVFFAPTRQQQEAGWPGNPNLWTRRHEIMTAIHNQSQSPPQSAASLHISSQATVARVTFQAMARIHAHYWRRADLLLTSDKTWLRGHAWLQGRDQDSWHAAQAMIQNVYQTKASTLESVLEWDPLVLAATHHAMAAISWEAQRQRLHTETHYTLVHGDFWPGNVLWMLPKKDHKDDAARNYSVRLIDWEMCGIGSGPQDLGQYVISNMEPGERKSCERALVQAYYDELVSAGVEGVSFEYCWKEYRIGGVERWLWFLVYFLGLDGFTEWAQFFHNQIAAFMRDHGLTATDIGQPRP